MSNAFEHCQDWRGHTLGALFEVVSLILLFSSIYQNSCLAGGYIVPHQTARALGLSNATTAGVNDPSAVYYNPAALGEVQGNNLLISGTYIGLVSSVENSGRRAVNKHDDNFLATIFANYHLSNSDFTFGIGAYTPFGLATTYESDFTRFAAERTELTKLLQFCSSARRLNAQSLGLFTKPQQCLGVRQNIFPSEQERALSTPQAYFQEGYASILSRVVRLLSV